MSSSPLLLFSLKLLSELHRSTVSECIHSKCTARYSGRLGTSHKFASCLLPQGGQRYDFIAVDASTSAASKRDAARYKNAGGSLRAKHEETKIMQPARFVPTHASVFSQQVWPGLRSSGEDAVADFAACSPHVLLVFLPLTYDALFKKSLSLIVLLVATSKHLVQFSINFTISSVFSESLGMCQHFLLLMASFIAS